METNLTESRKLQFKKSIIILTIVSLVITVTCFLESFTRYRGSDLVFSFGDSNIFTYLNYFVIVAPAIVFAICVFTFSRQSKAKIMLSISLGLIACRTIYSLIRFSVPYGFYYLGVWRDILVAVPFILATINSLRASPQKVYIIVAVACGILGVLWDLFAYIVNMGSFYIRYKMYLYWFTQPLAIIGRVALYLALLFFCLKNKMSAVEAKKEQNMK